MVVRRSLRLAAALVLCCALAQAEDEEVNCKGMRVKALNNFLRARGLACEGCAEKADYVKLCEEHKDTPVLPPKEEPAAAAAPEKEKDVDDVSVRQPWICTPRILSAAQICAAVVRPANRSAYSHVPRSSRT